ncbi:PhnD/SsuA/transferrin family substrate-binding protein [Sutterella sp.]|uniref:PhnD/SsuA/transferrin family substrate-binding protein n=1 Tax=Sutterella sp. TaxID=1981025 RepID=UPI0026DFC08A|nr:sensor histidine kinase [Sutterella sp.]MDO5531685.1 PhnD/SsuA/transferrin family substrate-binding protein [Sutterella sp.]
MQRNAGRGRAALLAILLAAAALAQAGAAEPDAAPIRIAVAVQSPPWSGGAFLRESLRRLEGTELAGRMEIRWGSVAEVLDAMRTGGAEFFVCDASAYGSFHAEGVRILATAVSARQPDPDHGLAAAVVVRRDSAVLDLRDLAGAPFAAAGRDELAGMLALRGELARAGLEPDEFLRSVKYYGATGGRRALEAVVRGEARAAVVRSGLIEDIAEAAGVDLTGELRVIPAPAGAAYTLHDLHSTAAYPNMIFGSTASAPRELIRSVQVSLLGMPENPWGEHWSVGPSLGEVDALFETLSEGPYAWRRSWTVERIWREYRTGVVVAGLLIVFLLLHGWLAERLVRRRTRELSESLATEKRQSEELQRLGLQISALERSGIAGQMSSLIAHDLKHPLAAILNLVRTLSTRIERGIAEDRMPLEEGVAIQDDLERIGESAAKAAAAIDHVRARARGNGGAVERLDLAAVVRGVLRDFTALRSEKTPVEVTGAESLPVDGRRIEIELLVLNLLKNAVQAAHAKGAPPPRIRVRLFTDGGGGAFTIENSAAGLTDEALERIRAFAAPTSRADGLGLGLGLIRTLAEAHRARIRMERSALGGLSVTVTFPPVTDSSSEANQTIGEAK